MTRKRNAGYKAAKANMAASMADASDIVQFNKSMDEIMDRFQQRIESVDAVMKRLAPELGLARSISPLFGTRLLDPMEVVRMSNFAPSPLFDFEDEDTVSEIEKQAALTARQVPPLFAPRDNGHRQSDEDLQKLAVLIKSSPYAAPVPNRDKFDQPEWPEGTELVSGRHPDAGEWGKLCYRTACQRPYAFFYNKGTQRHYCQECADVIDRENMSGEKLHHLAEFEGQHATN